MLKNIIGSVVFVIAVLALVNFVGDIMVNPDTEVAATSPEPVKADVDAGAPATSDMGAEADDDAADEDATDDDAADEAVSDEDAAAAKMVADGQKTFKRKCATCHTADQGGQNRVGPNLWGVVGREKAVVEGFRYSTNLKTMGGTWTEDDLSAFIANPRGFVADTKMMFPGIKDEDDRDAVISYLETLQDG